MFNQVVQYPILISLMDVSQTKILILYLRNSGTERLKNDVWLHIAWIKIPFWEGLSPMLNGFYHTAF